MAQFIVRCGVHGRSCNKIPKQESAFRQQKNFHSNRKSPSCPSCRNLALATIGPQRWDMFPNVPTMREAGLSDSLICSTWMGLIGLAGLPAEVVSRANRAFVSAVESPEVRKRMLDMGLIPRATTPEGFTGIIRSGSERVGNLVRTANIKLQ